jgi:lipopolysaccharide/colanic/teichoic acid biosynthesis glycosyltransferase/acetyltransferase-like isoleucine patch superfamily enzyme
MKAVILSRGQAPWLASYAADPCQELFLLNKPFLNWQIEALRESGIDDICVLHAPHATLDRTLSDILYRQEDFLKGAAGALQDIRDWLDNEFFLLCHGTTFLNTEGLRSFLNKPCARDAQHVATIGVVEKTSEPDIGEALTTDSNGSLKAFHRWHRSHNRRTSNHCAGVYLLHPKILEYIPVNQYYDLKEQLFPQLLAAGHSIETDNIGNCLPILTPEYYLQLHFNLLRDLDNNRVSPAQNDEAKYRHSFVHEKARLIGHVQLGDHCRIESDVTLIGPVVIGSYCQVEAGASIIGPTVLGNGCHIGARSILQYCVFGNTVTLGADSRADHSLLGSDQNFASGVNLHRANSASGLSDGISARSLVTKAGLPSLRHMAPVILGLRNATYCALKFIFDKAAAAMLLLFTLPLWMLVAVLIYLDSPGPVFYVQRRCGVRGKEFAMCKFRTMVVEAEKIQDKLRSRNEVDGPVFKLAKDPRITKVGAFLRKTSIDELPQLLNVLKGDMSLVGPRPLAMMEMRLNPNWRDLRLTVKPGITGLWQVESRSQERFHNWIHLDIEYVRKRSLLFDFKILMKTILVATRGS